MATSNTLTLNQGLFVSTASAQPIAPIKPLRETDEALVKLVLGGDKEAYRTLFERHITRVRAIAYEILRNREDAEDVAQESFVKVYLSLASFKGESAFYTWLYRIVYNMSVDLKRKRARRGGDHVEFDEQKSVNTIGERGSSETNSDAAFSSPTPSPLEALHWKEVRGRMQRVLSDLSDEHRLVIILREVDGLPYDEIAKITGVPRGTVMSRLHYARKALQKELIDVAPNDTVAENTPLHESFDMSFGKKA